MSTQKRFYITCNSFPSTKKIIFYTQNRWAFGAIHHSLCKELYKHNIYANLLDEDKEYTKEEFQLLNNTYDLFVTNPDKVIDLHIKSGIPLNKIVAVAHGQWDILLAKHNASFDFYPHIHSFGVISNILKTKCKEWNISVEPKVVETGVHFDLFYAKPSNQLKVVGYGGAKQTYNFYGQEIKRGHLVEKACQNIKNIQLQISNSYSYLCMPGYYKTVDCIIMSSIEEAGGLPVLEAAASGRLVIGTPVGLFEERALKGGGILVPLEENAFVEQTRQTVLYYRDNLKEYVSKCLEIQAYARDHYDWSKKIIPWIELLS
jgi:glycosyltransferase involved in cell wall biosynthesis